MLRFVFSSAKGFEIRTLRAVCNDYARLHKLLAYPAIIEYGAFV